MCMLEVNSDMCVIAHVLALLKHLADGELWRKL